MIDQFTVSGSGAAKLDKGKNPDPSYQGKMRSIAEKLSMDIAGLTAMEFDPGTEEYQKLIDNTCKLFSMFVNVPPAINAYLEAIDETEAQAKRVGKPPVFGESYDLLMKTADMLNERCNAGINMDRMRSNMIAHRETVKDKMGLDSVDPKIPGKENPALKEPNAAAVELPQNADEELVRSNAMTDDSGAVTKLEIQKLRKNLDAKHRVSFIGGSSSRHLRDLKTAVDNYLNFMDGKPGFEGTDETEMLYIVSHL